MAPFIKRQFVEDDYFVFEREPSFWWTKTGQIVRWSVFLGLFTILTAYIFIGYFHARSRMKKGLPLLAYHRWLINRERRIQYDPSYTNPNSYYTQYAPQPGLNAYNGRTAPPPIYDPTAPLPPSYQLPQGAGKLETSQWSNEPPVRRQSSDPSPGYDAPLGPPPSALVQK